MWKKRMASLMAVMALCGTLAASAADYTILEKTNKVETTVYGTTQTGSLNDRIAGLDTLLNGQNTVDGSIQDKTNELYKDVYGNSGSDLSLLAAVNLMQWQYSGQITEEPILLRVENMETGIDGKPVTGSSLIDRVHSLRRSLLGNKKYVSQAVTIPAGTIVTMKILEDLNSKTAQEGETVRFAVAEDVLVGDVVAIPRGMEAEGTITNARKSGRFGRDGKIEITYHTVRAADGTPVALIVGEKTKEEYKRTAGAVGASAAGAIILGPVGLVGGLFVHGNDVQIPTGTVMYAETKDTTDVVGFRQNGTIDDMKTANMAASGVAVSEAQDAVEVGRADQHSSTAHEGVTPVNLENGSEKTADEQTTVTIHSSNDNVTGEVHE
ncbi:hypothetical protein AB840_13020 [Megasphaera cerevisiae DSM 20462]|uniref:G5 domain-containing protein n=1 Tax=Megasphaera cerevisiae DSM 20462 TaxID=1122219 RepID=A0A0J6ZL30_9FIRM|nr:hypothetical protein [Megasphaera cerevisiae]KMO85541.1 hypothetical protein AB840_13020 [Megasphaera cerevisiae DSM 20462]SJZ74807.1 hypothetical protein SAMN05660900_01344 [Megasphaera cerevisiae DSM 20462]